MLQVKRVVNSVFSSNTYILFDEDSDYCWLVDVGDYKRTITALPDNKRIAGIMLTHTHFDHIYGLNDMCKRFPECVVYTSEYGQEALMDDKKNLSRYHEHPILFEGRHLRTMRDGDEILLFGNEKMVVKETPGHDPGCLTFLTDRFIFTGDSYIPGIKVVTKLPGGNRFQSEESVRMILELSREKIICPGHGETCSSHVANQIMNRDSVYGRELVDTLLSYVSIID